MIITKQRLDTFLLSSVVFLVVVDAGLLYARHHLLHDAIVQDPRSFFKNVNFNRSVQMPRGFSETGTVYKPSDLKGDTGLVIRFASRNCRYCREDQPFWNVVAQEAFRKHYKVVIVTPSAGDEYPQGVLVPSQAAQMTFVNLQWLLNLRLNKTPTTLIAGMNQELLWGHEGALTNEDVQEASAIIRRASR